ncbi:MAG: ribonuclease P protein component, partial [Patescibacteria group bacterium]
MLPRENRITEKKDFDEVRNKGRLVQSDSFAFGFIDNNAGTPSRFGFVVSTKISKKATLRNRVKRAMREGVRQNLTYIKKGIDGVFLAKTSILNKPTPEIMKEV